MYNPDPTIEGPMDHATIQYPEPPVHALHPLKNKANHDKLRRYVLQRLVRGASVRDNQLARYAQIDKDVSGWMKLSDEDKVRIKEQFQNGVPKARLMNLPISWIQLDDMLTYLVQTFSPGKAMFYHTGKPDEADASNQIVLLMNNHSIYAGYYRQMIHACFAMLKYNIGGFMMGWEEEFGPRLARDETGTVQSINEKVWVGNKIQALDMYNTLFDPTVNPVDLFKDGEWACRVRIKSHYWLAVRAAQGIYFNVKDCLDSKDNEYFKTMRFYKHPPTEAQFGEDESTTSNWISRLSDSPNHFNSNGYEIVETYIRLNPTDFGLIPGADKAKRNRYETWRVTMLGDRDIIDCTVMNNVHNHIPFYVGLVNDDAMERNQKSVEEILQPLQNFASHLMNIHIQATRKKLFGLTFYDKSIVDLAKIPDGEVAGFIPAEITGQGKKISDGIYEHKTEIDTERTMQDLSGIFQIVQQFFPLQASPSQIASIDRAVSSQVAAVQQGTNRRIQKIATLLDASCFRPMRFGMYYNILQYQDDGADVVDFRGRSIKVDLSTLKQTDLPFIIGMGLKAIDRQAIADRLQQVIFALIQNPNSAARVDVLAMIDYWTDMLDVDIDMKQFQVQQNPSQIPPGQEAQANAAGEAAGQAQPNVVPMTNPSAVTAPLRG